MRRWTKALAASGLLVVAIDLRRAPEAPYPASVQDANYGVRWLKAKAREWNGDPATVGALGSSSGGHEIELCAMRPHDPRYNAHPLPEAPNVDATLPYVVARSPVSDPFARYQQAERRQWAEMIQNSKIYFNPVGNHLRRQSAAHPRAPRAGDTCRRFTCCKANWTTTSCRLCKRNLPPLTGQPVENANWRSLRAASTAGSLTRAHKPTAPTKESRPSSRASSARGVWRHRRPFAVSQLSEGWRRVKVD